MGAESAPAGAGHAAPAGADVVVVGGGVAGLVTARALAHAGVDVLVLEASDRLGGCVAVHDVDAGDRPALRLDAGAESFATRSPVVLDLVTELGLADDVVVPAPFGAWVQLPDGALPLPRAGVLGIPSAPWSPDVRRAIGVLGALRASADRVLPASVGLGDGGPVSLGHLVRARFGRRVLERLVAPVVTGVHSAEPDDVDLDAVLPTVRGLLREHGSLGAAVGRVRAAAPAGSAVAGLRGGMNRLVTALADDVVAHGGRIRTGATVAGLVRDGAGWRLAVDGDGDGDDDGARETVGAGTVVLAVPGPAAARLAAHMVPQVRDLATPVDTGVVLATLVLDAAVLDAAPRGTGVLVAAGVPGVRAKALTHATTKWAWLAQTAGGRHVVRLSYGRAGGRLPEDVDEDLEAVALADAARLLGVELRPQDVVGFARRDWPGGLPYAQPGHRDRVVAVRDALGRAGVRACGAWLAGTGLVAVVADAQATAQAILESPRPPLAG
ncbi:protoporphyrinogen oxidase [Actinotalea subterranea]|uniref:protoporphyrinogen oxidase n=1 Tax=Actinotalea subterranea TaxID=2607497 RepID=UPI001FE91102|nr:protoporphyrinogen oxidase [Actinotalea subterranea]